MQQSWENHLVGASPEHEPGWSRLLETYLQGDLPTKNCRCHWLVVEAVHTRYTSIKTSTLTVQEKSE